MTIAQSFSIKKENDMAELRSIQDAERGMPLTVDSKMANEIHELVVEAGKNYGKLK